MIATTCWRSSWTSVACRRRVLSTGRSCSATIEASRVDIDFVVERIGDFDADNRAGLERTLHRIAAIRNRRGHIVGLTCRVGRAVYGTTDIIKDLIESDKSLLLLGRPACWQDHHAARSRPLAGGVANAW